MFVYGGVWARRRARAEEGGAFHSVPRDNDSILTMLLAMLHACAHRGLGFSILWTAEWVFELSEARYIEHECVSNKPYSSIGYV